MNGPSGLYFPGAEPSQQYQAYVRRLLDQPGGPYACPSDDEVDRALEEEAAMEMSAEWQKEHNEAMSLPKP